MTACFTSSANVSLFSKTILSLVVKNIVASIIAFATFFYRRFLFRLTLVYFYLFIQHCFLLTRIFALVDLAKSLAAIILVLQININFCFTSLTCSICILHIPKKMNRTCTIVIQSSLCDDKSNLLDWFFTLALTYSYGLEKIIDVYFTLLL